MRAAYTIFPHSGYILETFRGAVTYNDIVRFNTRQQNDPRILSHYHTVSDYVQATLHLTEAEVRLHAQTIYASPKARIGKRSMVVVGPRNLAVVSMLEMLAADYDVLAQCFRSREAAFRWQGDQVVLPTRVSSTNAALSYLADMGLETTATR
jgi:hypothetical protein